MVDMTIFICEIFISMQTTFARFCLKLCNSVEYMDMRRKFSRGDNVGILLILFRLLTIQCRWMFTKCFTHSTQQRKIHMLRQESQNLHFVGSNAYFSHASFHAAWKLGWYYQQSLSRCIYCNTCLHTTVECAKTPAAVSWIERLNICCHVTVTQWRPTLEQSDCKFRSLPLQANEWAWVNCKLIIASHQDSERHKEDCKLITTATNSH